MVKRGESGAFLNVLPLILFGIKFTGKVPMDFPLAYIPTHHECYQMLSEILHPGGLKCPAGHELKDSRIHRSHRAPILDYRCKKCGRIFNVFTGTVLQGSKFNALQIIQCMNGISRGVSINRLAQEMKIDRKGLAKKCEKIKDLIPEIKNTRPENEWISIFREVQWWETENDPEAVNGTRLVVKVRNGGCYALARIKFDSIDPVTSKKTEKIYTGVKWLPFDYFSKRY